MPGAYVMHTLRVRAAVLWDVRTILYTCVHRAVKVCVCASVYICFRLHINIYVYYIYTYLLHIAGCCVSRRTKNTARRIERKSEKERKVEGKKRKVFSRIPLPTLYRRIDNPPIDAHPIHYAIRLPIRMENIYDLFYTVTYITRGYKNDKEMQST